jgi:hypothetical protein
VLLPCNFPMMQNPQYAADFEALVAVCRERSVAVQTIKSLTAGPWAERQQRFYTTWYRPLEDQADVGRAVHWVLGRPGLFLNTAGDTRLLPKVLDAASRFERAPAEDEMREMAARRSMRPLFV